MIFITSPAKTQDFTSSINPKVKPTKPEFITEADILANKISTLGKNDLRKLLSVSEKLTDLNYERFKNWGNAESRPAIHVYKGDIYRQFEINDFNKKESKYLQDHLRIITGMYGILKAYDLIKPYRLEMKTSLRNLKSIKQNDLYEMWSEKVTESINKELMQLPEDKRYIINLASNEYSKVINKEKLQGEFIDIKFIHDKKGAKQPIGIYAKQARGLFIKFVAEKNVLEKEQLKNFDYDGYKVVNISKSELVFEKKV